MSTSYYKKHQCVQCGRIYGAFTPNSTHCPDCMHEQPHTCEYCGADFSMRKIGSRFCQKHRYMQSPAFLTKYAADRTAAAERKAKREEVKQAKESEKELKRIEAEKARKLQDRIKNRVVTEVMVFEHRPETPEPKKQQPVKPEDKFFLKVGKARYGFVSQERLDNFKKRNGIA